MKILPVEGLQGLLGTPNRYLNVTFELFLVGNDAILVVEKVGLISLFFHMVKIPVNYHENTGKLVLSFKWTERNVHMIRIKRPIKTGPTLLESSNQGLSAAQSGVLFDNIFEDC